jgi:hypothetical protein
MTQTGTAQQEVNTLNLRRCLAEEWGSKRNSYSKQAHMC